MRRLVALSLVAGLLVGCGGAAPPAGGGGKAPVAAAGGSLPTVAGQLDGRAQAAGERFGLALLQQVQRGTPGDSVLISPLSASMILALTAGGAKGDTLAQMAQALQWGDLTPDQVHANHAALLHALAAKEAKVELNLATAIWHRADLKPDPAMAALARERYGSTLQPARFGEPQAVKAINDWTSQATRGRIPTILDETRANDVMVLVNALYFKGQWQRPFDPKRTASRSFTRLDGTKQEHPFMQGDGTWGYQRGEGYQGVRLPYGDGSSSMLLFLPDEGVGVERLVQGLTPERWATMLRGFNPAPGMVVMPKFKLNDGVKLNDHLAAMGMVEPFDLDRADFSGLFGTQPPGMAIRLVLQKSFLEVNEEGSEAAAATAVVVTTKSAPVADRFNFVADRPFLLAIRHDATGALLFLGVIGDLQ